jgi:hypothetical protein
MNNGYEDSERSEMTKRLDLDSCDRENDLGNWTWSVIEACKLGEIPVDYCRTFKAANGSDLAQTGELSDANIKLDQNV